jgi:hypothetical protein
MTLAKAGAPDLTAAVNKSDKWLPSRSLAFLPDDRSGQNDGAVTATKLLAMQA